MSAFTPAGFLAVGLGAVLGAWIRWGLSASMYSWLPDLPLGTLVANISGGFLIGMALAWFATHEGLNPQWRLFAVTGFLGALTTFSSFSAESLTLLQKGLWGWALVHSVVHLFGSLAAAALGFRLVGHA